MNLPSIYVSEVMQVFIEDNNLHVVLGASSGCQDEAGKDVLVESIRFTISSTRFKQLIDALSEAKEVLLESQTREKQTKTDASQPPPDSKVPGEKQVRHGEPLVFSFNNRKAS